jgi:excisionase family DNA binding protein
MAGDRERKQGHNEWLPLGKAAAILGVHGMTLRRWSDSGHFPCYRTAGGHRRYALQDIKAYLLGQSSGNGKALANTWANKALTQTRQQVAAEHEQRWMQAIGDEDLRREYRRMGHQLMGLLLQYVASDEPDDSFVEEAQRMGRRYGVYGMRLGLPLSDIVEATLFFRDILLESSLEVPSTTYVESNANLRILRRVNQIINAIQLSVTRFYETAGPAAGQVVDQEPDG